MQAAHYLIRTHLEHDARGPAALPPRLAGYSAAAHDDPADILLPPAKRLKQQRITAERTRCRPTAHPQQEPGRPRMRVKLQLETCVIMECTS